MSIFLARRNKNAVIFTLYKASTLSPQDPLEGGKGVLGTRASECQFLKLRVLLVHLHHIVWVLLVRGGRRRRREEKRKVRRGRKERRKRGVEGRKEGRSRGKGTYVY